MKTQYYTATSIDGFIADADNSLEWLFTVGSADEEGMKDEYPNFMAEVGAHGHGLDHLRVDRSTTRGSSTTRASGSTPSRPGCSAAATCRSPRASTSGWSAATSGRCMPTMVDAADGKNVWLVGGGELVGQFHDAGLLDELILGVAPVFLGAGAPLLPRRITAPTLRLTDVTRYGGTFVTLRYAVEKQAT